MANDTCLDFQTRTIQLYSDEISLETHSRPVNFGDAVVIWLKSEEELPVRRYIQIVNEFKSSSDYLEIFTDNNKCIDFISSVVYEKVFLVIAFTKAELLIPLIHNLRQLVCIYICDETEQEAIDDKFLNWMLKFPAVHGNVQKLNATLFDQVRHDIECMRSRVAPFKLCSTTATKNSSIQDLNNGHVSYKWNRLLLDAMRKLPQKNKSKQDILNECKAQYSNNKPELQKIEQFEKTYQSHLAIWWYTRDCFLYKLINRALRTEDIDVVFKFRFIVTDLYNQLLDLHNHSISEKQKCVIVYRGQQLAANELEVLKLNINGCISMNTFVSTTKNEDVALMFAGDGSGRPLSESVLFEMIITIDNSDLPCADISEMSDMSHEEEVLLAMGMIFKINSIEEIDNHV